MSTIDKGIYVFESYYTLHSGLNQHNIKNFEKTMKF